MTDFQEGFGAIVVLVFIWMLTTVANLQSESERREATERLRAVCMNDAEILR